MSNIFKPKRSNTASSVPTTANLADGELAVNSADKIIYLRDGASVVQLANFSTGSGSGGGIQIRDDGNIIGTGVTAIDFAGSGISTTTVSGGVATVTIPNAWTTVRKLVDETLTTSTTLQNDDALQFSMAANTQYVIRITVFYNTPAAADFKHGFNGPAGATLIRMHRRSQNPNATAFTLVALATAYDATGVTIATTATDGYIVYEGIVKNGATAGTFRFTWAQATASGTSTVYEGSYLEYAIV